MCVCVGVCGCLGGDLRSLILKFITCCAEYTRLDLLITLECIPCLPSAVCVCVCLCVCVCVCVCVSDFFSGAKRNTHFYSTILYLTGIDYRHTHTHTNLHTNMCYLPFAIIVFNLLCCVQTKRPVSRPADWVRGSGIASQPIEQTQGRFNWVKWSSL